MRSLLLFAGSFALAWLYMSSPIGNVVGCFLGALFSMGVILKWAK